MPDDSLASGWWWKRDGNRVSLEVREVETRFGPSGSMWVSILVVALIAFIAIGGLVGFGWAMVVSLCLLIWAGTSMSRGRANPMSSVSMTRLDADQSGLVLDTNMPDLKELLNDRANFNSFLFQGSAEQPGRRAVVVADIVEISVEEFGDGAYLAVLTGEESLGMYVPADPSELQDVATEMRNVLGLARSRSADTVEA
ncbi:MAG: hypothetical protein AAGK78_00915 [Planctomycetota bacterium]